MRYLRLTMPATTRTTQNMTEESQSYPRPMTSKQRPKTTKGKRNYAKSAGSKTSSDEGQERRWVRGSDDTQRDTRLLHRAKTAPSSKYHSSCSLSSASTDSLGSSTSSYKSASMKDYPNASPDTIHVTCRVSNDKPGYYEFLRPYSAYTKPLWREPKLPQAFQSSKKLNHPDLTEGEKFYLWKTATVYGVTNMKKANQQRYENMLRHTVETGFHTEEEIKSYMNYFKGSRKHQFHTDPSVWRAPPRIPVRPLHFRSPPTSPRGWNSYSPQGSLGSGRSQSAKITHGSKDSAKSTPRSDKSTNKKEGKKNQNQQRKKETRSTKEKEEDDPVQDDYTGRDGTDKENEIGRDSPRDEQTNDDQDDTEPEAKPGPQIYYDMKLKRTVIKPGTSKNITGTSKNVTSGNKRSVKKSSAKDNNKVTFKEQQNSKDKESVTEQKPHPPKLSWEDKNTVPGRPKTSRGLSGRTKPTEQTQEQNDEESNDWRKSAISTSTSSATTPAEESSYSEANGSRTSSRSSGAESRSSGTSSRSSGTSSRTSGTESRSSGTSSRSSGTESRSSGTSSRSSGTESRSSGTESRSSGSSSRSSGTLSRSSETSSESGTLSRSSGSSSRSSGTMSRGSETSSSSTSSSGTSSSGNSGSGSPSRSSSRADSRSSHNSDTTEKRESTRLRPIIRSAVGNRVIEVDDDEARAALAQSFWKKDKGHAGTSS